MKMTLVKNLTRDWLFWLSVAAAVVSVCVLTGCSTPAKFTLETGTMNAPGFLSGAVKAVASATGLDWLGPLIGGVLGVGAAGGVGVATKRAHKKGKAEAKAEASPPAAPKV